MARGVGGQVASYLPWFPGQFPVPWATDLGNPGSIAGKLSAGAARWRGVGRFTRRRRRGWGRQTLGDLG